ncbi:MAG TPA: tryptophan synthase subunit alpha [Candidatus Omnitrophota bacterium]|nr:tryptophan synthase subunit alpha [Candidatus Omnitrophota bacterium]HRY85271.1 tryptophan synthase subunit alpha [Candidatus Omnitrophota bacterium]
MATIDFLTQKISQAKRKKAKLFCVFLTLGYPSLPATERLIFSAERSGVDILELGFPFSDPLADGPTIQFSSEKALQKNVNIHDGFRLVSKLRAKGCKMPVVFFGYFNPVCSYGAKDFARDAKKAGFGGLIIPDLPPEEEQAFQKECRKRKLRRIELVAPTTSDKRAKMLVQRSQGFVYYVSLRGVTGARKALPSDLKAHLAKLRRMTKKPVLAGFGISTPKQAADISRMADGVIVGSAVIEHLKRGIPAAERFIKKMSQAVHGV